MAGSIMATGGMIEHVHLADSNRRFPGQGHIDFRAIIKALEAISYQGYLSGEFLPLPSFLEAASGLRGYINTLLKEAR